MIILGIERFMEDIKLMLGKFPVPYKHWQFTWRFLTPFLLVVSTKFIPGSLYQIGKSISDHFLKIDNELLKAYRLGFIQGSIFYIKHDK